MANLNILCWALFLIFKLIIRPDQLPADTQKGFNPWGICFSSPIIFTKARNIFRFREELPHSKD